MKTTRRRFIQHSALGATGILLGTSSGAAAADRATHYDPYALVPLGRTSLKVSRLCLGTGVKGSKRESNHTRMGREKFVALLQAAYDRGVRTFDLADLYGTHPYVIAALKEFPRASFQIFTKIWFRSGGIPEPERPDADVVVSRFLRELDTDYIDLLLLHCVVAPGWPDAMRRQMDIMAGLKAKGIIRAHGLSCHSLAALHAAIDEPWVDSVHARINPFGMSMDGPPDVVAPVLQKLHAAGKGVVGMKIMGEGRLRSDRSKRSESVRYALELGCVDVLNVGCETLAEIDDTAALIREVPLPA